GEPGSVVLHGAAEPRRLLKLWLYLAIAGAFVADPSPTAWPTAWPWKPPESLVIAARTQVPEEGHSLFRLERLHRFIVSTDGLGVTAVDGATGTSAEVWRSRRADCVGFAYLFGGLARELGLDVAFAIEPLPGAPNSSSGRIRIQEAHVVVIHRDADGRPWIVDHAGMRPGQGATRSLTAPEAAALLWANLGARALVEGRCAEAVRLTRAAGVLAPRLSEIQANWRATARVCTVRAAAQTVPR
ncbi:MAG: hypothetical protein AAFY88_27340, partial [Acidobacteriota bacterium]